MNPSPTNNPLPATRGGLTVNNGSDFDVSFADGAFCDLSDWVDQELAVLEAKFHGFITARSNKHSIGR